MRSRNVETHSGLDIFSVTACSNMEGQPIADKPSHARDLGISALGLGMQMQARVAQSASVFKPPEAIVVTQAQM